MIDVCIYDGNGCCCLCQPRISSLGRDAETIKARLLAQGTFLVLRSLCHLASYMAANRDGKHCPCMLSSQSVQEAQGAKYNVDEET
jgi:Cys-tRNA synthase (O-phospho-L-seryl-tRNA:Cys-tRNA synthase)